MNDAAADRLGLHRDDAYPRKLNGIDGAILSGRVKLPGLSAGGVPIPNFGALAGSFQLPEQNGIVPDGLLGADILSGFDLDLDLPDSRIRLYKPSSCSAPPADWNESYSIIDANRSLHDRLFFDATLDGHRVAAIFDTGAQHTILDSRAAVRLGVGAPKLRDTHTELPRGILNSIQVAGRFHRFREIALKAQMFRYPQILVAPLNLEDADLILGTDMLKGFRVWLSYGLRRVFVARHW